ncbi:hypothetical protein BsWGS_18297 [Bradybaena similaris]
MALLFWVRVMASISTPLLKCKNMSHFQSLEEMNGDATKGLQSIKSSRKFTSNKSAISSYWYFRFCYGTSSSLSYGKTMLKKHIKAINKGLKEAILLHDYC